MDILDEVIEDYERMLGIITNRLNELKAIKRGGKVANNNLVKDRIETKRQEILNQIEMAKRNLPINRSKVGNGK